MGFDAEDVYDAAALYDMWLNCHSCPATFDFEPNRPIGLDYYHDIGQQAKQDGWVVAEQVDSAAPDEQAYLVLCPGCAARYGLSPADVRATGVPRAIREICHSMELAAQNVHAA